MILLFLFSPYFWTNALFHIPSTFDPLGSFSRTADDYTQRHRMWSKNFHSHKKVRASGECLQKIKISKSLVAFSLTCTLLWPKGWPPEPLPLGSTDWYLIVLGQYKALLVGTWFYVVGIGWYWSVLGGIGSDQIVVSYPARWPFAFTLQCTGTSALII